MIEQRIIELYPEGEMRCPTHFSIGQEAIAVGTCIDLFREDFVMSAHRSHAHYLAKGGDLKRMLAEMYGKETGCARGKGGSMHLIDTSVGFLGCVPIVGSTIPIGVGIAFGNKLQQKSSITVIFFGDGATETGVFHESLNYAAMHKLPVLFVCENNLYSVNTPLCDRQPKDRAIINLAKGHNIPTVQADGQKCDEVYQNVAFLIQKIRSGGGPAFVEFFTYRWLEHCGPNQDLNLGFRPAGEYEYWLSRDPLVLYQEQLLDQNVLTTHEIQNLCNNIELEINEAIVFAKQSSFPKRIELMSGVFPKSKKDIDQVMLNKEKKCQIEN